jgi:hypothetical protein
MNVYIHYYSFNKKKQKEIYFRTGEDFFSCETPYRSFFLFIVFFLFITV